MPKAIKRIAIGSRIRPEERTVFILRSDYFKTLKFKMLVALTFIRQLPTGRINIFTAASPHIHNNSFLL